MHDNLIYMARRPDPRVEVESEGDAPPSAVPRAEHVELPKDYVAPRSEPEPEPRSATVDAARVVKSSDPRLEGAELALSAGDWKRLAIELGSVGEAGKLPPNLGLLCALAHRESDPLGVADAEAQSLALRCVAAVLDVSPDSRIASVVSKRLMRRNPVAFRERPAPPASISALIMLAVVLLGSAIGWAFANGMIRIQLRV
jgi:hypothetical protein